MGKQLSQKSWNSLMSKTLNLPKSDFPMRANAAVREPELRKQCLGSLYSRQWQQRAGKAKFVLHDGPPFANGELHMGHFLNKILKDIIVRYKLLRGFQVHFVPGWDCHGMPIEHKALKEGGIESIKSKSMSAIDIRTRCKELAASAMSMQKQRCMDWGVMAGWASDTTYATMEPHFEAKQLEIFKSMVKKKLIYRSLKPVYWSPSSRTALAESELEYVDNHVSKASSILFPVSHDNQATCLKEFASLEAVIWTTTPWTIPSNMALAISNEMEYSVVQCNSRVLLVATERINALMNMWNVDDMKILRTMLGKELTGALFSHPLENRNIPLIFGDHVTTDAGTGIVHTAPGHGAEDYIAFTKSQFREREIRCVVDDDGLFTSDAGDKLEGLSVLEEGNLAVVGLLEDAGRLLHMEDYLHRYPYDWRTKKPVIFRATTQWFARLDSLHKKAHKALDTVNMVPKSARKRLEATLASRSEWCISRQRSWGVPIPAFYDKKSDEPLLTEKSISHVQKLFEQYGSDCWWSLGVDKLLAPQYQDEKTEYYKGTDTMDVWFDSGSSWHAILENDSNKQVADVYLEGSDQHRGWFQSSLLTSMVLQDEAPYKSLITHGFVLDEKHRKMSKSVGNVLDPALIIHGGSHTVAHKNPKKKPKQEKIPAYGVDVLRYWVAGTDYTSDVSVGPLVIRKTSEDMRRVRNAAKFMLGNLYDFKPHIHSVSYADLPYLDQYMLHQLSLFECKARDHFDIFAFSRVKQSVSHFIATDLSAFYMEICKDRLYCDHDDSHSRRSCQTVLAHCLEYLNKVVAPVACHTAEDINNHIPYKQEQSKSFFDHVWQPANAEWNNPQAEADFRVIRYLISEFNKSIESIRSTQKIGTALELELDIALCNESSILSDIFQRVEATTNLNDLFLCSSVNLCHKPSDQSSHESCEYTRKITVADLNDSESDQTTCIFTVKPSRKGKCSRCWKVNAGHEENALCARCKAALADHQEMLTNKV